jgi:hypothetical protein
MGTPKKKGLLSDVLFTLGGTLLFFVLVELGFRIVVALTSAPLGEMIREHRSRFYSELSPELVYRPHPFFGYVRQDMGPDDDINRLGFYGPDLEVAKPANTLRVVALGGSTTAGPESWPFQLEQVLKERLRDQDVQVQNLGMGGWTSAEAVAAFALVGLSYSPDIVVVHCVNNDLEPMHSPNPAVDYSHYRRPMNVVQTDDGAAVLSLDLADMVDVVAAKFSNLYIYAKLFQSDTTPVRIDLYGLTTWHGPKENDPSPLGLAIYERNLRSIGTLAEAQGATMVLATMPVMSDALPGVPTLAESHIASLNSQNQRLRHLANQAGWVLADIALISDDLGPHFEDAVHVDVAGERMKAEVIVDALLEAGVVRTGW